MSIDLSLDRVSILLSRFETYTRPTVHIAGTNGKGSVAAILSCIVSEAGLAFGRFNSPHLVDVHDCIYLGDSPVSKTLYESTHNEVRSLNEDQGIGASSFEVLTVTALLLFERAHLDVVICEVGMGGRLDATNIIPDAAILASVITAVDLDHQAFLGSTVAEIAREKAGIIRRGGLTVLSAQEHEEVKAVVEEIARSLKADTLLAPIAREREWREEIDGPLPSSFALHPFCPPPPQPVEVCIESTIYRLLLPLFGPHQMVNVGAAIALIHALRTRSNSLRNASFARVYERVSSLGSTHIHAAVRSCVWPGRMSFHTYNLDPPAPHQSPSRTIAILADGAHNAAASRTLASYILELLESLSQSQSPSGPKRIINLAYILALSHSPPKTPESVLRPLLESFISNSTSGMGIMDVKCSVAFLRFTPPGGMPWVRSVPPVELREVARAIFSRSSASSLATDSELGTAKRLSTWDIWEPEGEAILPDSSGLNPDLEIAIRWAAAHSKDAQSDTLIVVAGSLYLVADMYRLLNLQ